MRKQTAKISAITTLKPKRLVRKRLAIQHIEKPRRAVPATLLTGVQCSLENHRSSDAGAETMPSMKSNADSSPQLLTSAIGELTSTGPVRKGRAKLPLISRSDTRGQLSTSTIHPPEPTLDVSKGRARSAAKTSSGLRGQPSTADHLKHETQLSIVSGGVDQDKIDPQPAGVHANLIDEVIEQWRRRQMWHRAEKSLTLQAKSMCRRLLAGDKTEAETLYKSALNGGDHAMAATANAAMFPLLEARRVIETHRMMVEKRLAALAKELPAFEFVDQTHGFGLLGFAGIVGEAGDLSKYANPAKLWKRMGLAVMPDGDRQRLVAGDAAIEHGYNPARRSVMWTIGDVIVKVGGPYREVYDKRKTYESEKNERGEYAERAARMLKQKSFAKTTAAFKCYSEGKLPPLHLHSSAKRVMEKRLLLDLWRVWRDAIHHLATGRLVHPSDLSPERDQDALDIQTRGVA